MREEGRPVLPWKVALQMSWANIANRLGRFALVFLGIAVVVAFLMSSFTYQSIVADLSASDDVHVRAVLEKAGIFASDEASRKYQADRSAWTSSGFRTWATIGVCRAPATSSVNRGSKRRISAGFSISQGAPPYSDRNDSAARASTSARFN